MFQSLINRRKYTVAVCDNCKRNYRLEQNVEDRPDPEPGVTQYGLLCPHCGAFALAYRSTRQLEQLRRQVRDAAETFRAMKTQAAEERWRKLQAQLQEAHDRLNPKPSCY